MPNLITKTYTIEFEALELYRVIEALRTHRQRYLDDNCSEEQGYGNALIADNLEKMANKLQNIVGND